MSAGFYEEVLGEYLRRDDRIRRCIATARQADQEIAMYTAALARAREVLHKVRRDVDATASPQHAAWADELNDVIGSLG